MEKEFEQIIEQDNEVIIENDSVPEIEEEILTVAFTEPAPAPKVEKTQKIREHVSGNKRILTGVVVSNKADKTIVIAVVRQVAHPLYKKYFKRTNKFMAHDELNECKIGDKVKVKESRPLSARKRWELVEIIERAK